MKKLSDYFSGFWAKHLAMVDVPKSKVTKKKTAAKGSNQHEIGLNRLKSILGDPEDRKEKFEAVFIYLGLSGEEKIQTTGELSWYNCRYGKPRSAEYRLYYPSNEVTLRMAEGDMLLVARVAAADKDKPEGRTLLFVVAKQGSTYENQLRWLFGISLESMSEAVQTVSPNQEISFVEAALLGALGIQSHLEDASWLDQLLEAFGSTFPSTAAFGEFARKSIQADPLNDPDTALLQWMAQEEMLFRTLERHLLQEKLLQPFDDVDDFIKFSLSVQNRRKSRVGRAFENHLAAIFQAHGLHFEEQVLTENKSKADFIFPGRKAYVDAQFPAEKLTLLAAKTTCKDRWRQVMAEADRIPNKHLITLEPGISKHQLEEMRSNKICLVVPRGLWNSYPTVQQQSLLTLSDFVQLVKKRAY